MSRSFSSLPLFNLFTSAPLQISCSWWGVRLTHVCLSLELLNWDCIINDSVARSLAGRWGHRESQRGGFLPTFISPYIWLFHSHSVLVPLFSLSWLFFQPFLFLLSYTYSSSLWNSAFSLHTSRSIMPFQIWHMSVWLLCILNNGTETEKHLYLWKGEQ